MRVNVSKALISKTFMYGLKVSPQLKQKQRQLITSNNKSLEFYLNLFKIKKPITLVILTIHLVALTILKEFATFATRNRLRLLIIVLVLLDHKLITNFISFNVFSRLTVLMNDFRLKTFYCKSSKTNKFNNKSFKIYNKTTSNRKTISKTTTATTSLNLNLKLSTTSIILSTSSLSSSSLPSSTAAAAASAVAFATSASTLLLLKQQTNSKNNNHHRTYNNSSKSNKVFLYYTPRDPRLRIFLKTKHFFNRPQQQKQQLQLNLTKSNNNNCCCIKSVKNLLFFSKVLSDLCNYGELIGGSRGIHKSGEYNNSVIKNNNNKNNNKLYKTIVKQLNSANTICYLNKPKEICDKLSDNLIIIATAGAAIETISANILFNIISVAVLTVYAQELLKTIEILLSFHYNHQQLEIFNVKSTFGLHDSIL